MENKELNKLIIIGNGFDLAHGLKTGYKDFMLWVLKTEFENYKKFIQDYKKTGNIGDRKSLDIIDFSSFTEPIPEYEIDNVISKNLKEFNNYFFDENPNFSLKERGDVPFYVSDSQILRQSHSAKLKNIIEIKNNLFRHLLFWQKQNSWVDIEKEFYKILISFFKNEVSIFEFKSLDLYLNDFEQIKLLLEQYLISIKDNYIRPIPKISTFFKELPKFDKTRTIHPVLICNFNYTGTLDSYVRKETDMDYDDICFIHGEIERSQNPIIFGFGDEKDENYLPMESSKDDRFLKYIKSFAYLKTPYYSKLLSFIDAGKYEVIIMGHSCGQSDRVLLKTIFEHDNCHEIIIKYYKRPDGTDDFDEKAKEIARSFTDKALFRKRVVHYQDERVTSLT